MDIRPILSTLLRHKTAAALIVFEIALSCAIICNALFLISGRLERMERPTGLAESNVVVLQARGLASDEDAMAVTTGDLAALRGIPGVADATIVNQVPFGNSMWVSSVRMSPDQQGSTMDVATYISGQHLLDTFGLELVAGRNFNADEVGDFTRITAADGEQGFPSVLLTRALADRLFPDGDALGKPLYIWGRDDAPNRVVGIVDQLPKPSDEGPQGSYHDAVILPANVAYSDGWYVLHVSEPERRQEVLDQAVQILATRGPTRIVDPRAARTLEEMRARYYRQDRAMTWLLLTVCLALLVVTALGIVGLASFWVQQRSKQIGIRRALGATRGQILRYFQTENFLLATLGIVLGMVLAYGLNRLLMQQYELARLPLAYLPLGALVLWLLGQLAVLGPARRAAAVPPAVATRST